MSLLQGEYYCTAATVEFGIQWKATNHVTKKDEANLTLILR